MSALPGPGSSRDERIEELAMCAATEGLDEAPSRELALTPDGVRRRAECEAAAAALHLAFVKEQAARAGSAAPRHALQPSAGFQERLLAQARATLSEPRSKPRLEVPEPGLDTAERARPARLERDRGSARSLTPLQRGGWLLAAAGLALSAWLGTELAAERAARRPVELAVRRQRLIATSADHTALPWTPLGHGAKEGLRGQVVWSDTQNEGYMTFDGLAPNDPAVAQYQLWIFRGADLAAEPHPVDGGVFNVSTAGEVIVPIDAKLEVGRGTTFVVTLEAPGGVVVSDRSRLVALAQRAG